MGDVPVATLQPNGTGVSVYYIHTDHLNAPRRITRPADNTIVWRWDSEPFGTAAASQNPSGIGTFAYNLRFPGQYYDAETGLNYNYFRDFDPAVGRYVESDPLGLKAGTNTYAYVGGNPLSRIDLYGLASPEAAIAEAIARADVEALETLLEAADANQAKLIEAGLKRLNTTADQLISQECKAGVRGRFPKSVLQNTLKEINELAESGDKDAQTAWKLLTNNRFKK
jgi:RHS repeat-associated protein